MLTRIAAVFALTVLCNPGASSYAQTSKELAQQEADTEKAKADAAEARLRAKKAQLDIDQADQKAKLDLQKSQQEVDDKRRAAIGDAAKSLSEASLKGDIKDVAVTGTPIETRALAHRALTPITDRLVQTIQPVLTKVKPTSVILADDQVLALLPIYQATEDSLKRLSTQYSGLLKDTTAAFGKLKDNYQTSERAFAAAFPLVLEGVAALANLAQTFKTQISVTATDVTIDNLAFQGALISSWAKASKPERPVLIAYPGLVADIGATEVGKTLQAITDTQGKALDLDMQMNLWLTEKKALEAKTKPKPKAKAAPAAKGAAAKAKPAEGTADAKDPPEPEASPRSVVVAAVEALDAKLKAANERVDQVLQSLTSTSEKQPVPALAQLVKSGHVVKALKASSLILNAKVVSAGGNSLATNNLWTGPKLFHSGGAIVAYSLIKSDGSFVAGEVLDSHTGYIRMPRNAVGGLGSSWTPAP